MREYFRKIAIGDIMEDNRVSAYEEALEDLRSHIYSVNGKPATRETAAMVAYVVMKEMGVRQIS